MTIGSLGRLTAALRRAERKHKLRRRTPIYLTEFGIQSVPDPLYGVSQQRQNEFRAISERIAWANPRVKWFSQYLLRDDDHLTTGPRLSRYPGFESGLRFADGRPKLSLRSFAVPLTALRTGNRVSLWGMARRARRAVTVTILADVHRYKRKHTDGRGYFRLAVPYVPGREYQLRWGATVSARVRVFRP